MKTLKLLFAFLVLTVCASAQTLLTNTTLSAAVANGRQQGIQVTSTTGIVVNTFLVIDTEVMAVVNVPSTGTIIGVVRGSNGTVAKPHVSGAYIFIVPIAATQAITNTDPQGACTRGSASLSQGQPTSQSTLYLPIYSTQSRTWWDCVGGNFVGGLPLQQVNAIPSLIYNIPTGGTIYTSIDTNGVALAATTDLYCSELDLPYSKVLQGIKMLNGTSVATDHHIYSLYDSQGVFLAASASTTSFGSASEYGGAAFSTPYLAVGPAQYFTCVQPVTAAGTASIRMAITQVNDFINAGIVTITAGSAPASITVPSGFTTAQGPYSAVY
jgi:hypothetical protein